jgi:hypothetical protein
MKNYNIFSDYEKQQKLKEVESEYKRLNKSKYWVLKQLSIPKSTYYDWLKTNGVSKDKTPKTIWNKTPKVIEDKILEIRDNNNIYKSKRTPVGIANELEKYGVFMTSVGVWNVLKRNNKNRNFVDYKKTFIIFPKAEKFLDVVCIDDTALTNWKPRDLAIFNAIDEYSHVSVGILFTQHRINKYDVIELLKQIKKNYGRLLKTVRLDNARAHSSIAVKKYCKENNIKLQFIDPGTPQQNWPVESFNGVIKKYLINTSMWKWNDLSDKQELLEKYREYYNNEKPLNSDPLKRTPNEIATAITSKRTQQRLKYKLIRKHFGQIAVQKAILKKQTILTPVLSEMCVN